MAAKDMYADLEKIEARGKRKKEKSKGFFSSFGNKDEPEPDESQSPEPEETLKPTPEPVVPAKEPMFSKREDTHPTSPKVEPPTPKTQPIVPAKEPMFSKRNETHPTPPKVEPPTPKIQPIVPAKEPIIPKPQQAKPAAQPKEPESQPKSSWKPLTGGKLSKAQEDLLVYKKWLNKGYKSGILTKEQCTIMVRTKEIELGLTPPE